MEQDQPSQVPSPNVEPVPGNSEAAPTQIESGAPANDSAIESVGDVSKDIGTSNKKGPTEDLVHLTKLGAASREQIIARLSHDIENITSHPSLSSYCLVAILDPATSISNYELDQIYQGLNKRNSARDKNILLLLLSHGGGIEPAYQISKLCKSFSREKFVVCAPRFAKSAATLIALGADEVHLGPLSQLGPIDPQIDGMPALAVAHALNIIAETAAKYPRSAEMFARYLEAKLSVQQIGYFERIAESAVQYAERLLLAKPAGQLPKAAADIAREMVHEYKDHGFVIDIEEARSHLGKSWVLSDTPLAAFAETFYSMLNVYNLFLRPKRKIALIGSLHPEDIARTLFLMDDK